MFLEFLEFDFEGLDHVSGFLFLRMKKRVRLVVF